MSRITCLKDKLSSCLQHGFVRSEENVVVFNNNIVDCRMRNLHIDSVICYNTESIRFTVYHDTGFSDISLLIDNCICEFVNT